MNKNLSQLIIFILINLAGYAQSVGVGTSTPHPSAKLEISSSNQGTLITRMTTAERKAISNPAAGLLVFDLTKNCIYFFDGQSWRPMNFTDEKNLSPTPRTPSDPRAYAYFGYSVSISGEYAIVGKPYDSINLNLAQGSAYIFKRIGGVWIEQAKLVASDGSYADWFGSSVSISDDLAVVGARSDDSASLIAQGSAYIFQRNGNNWIQRAKLRASDGANGDYFGYSVSISGSLVLIGSPYDDVGSNYDQGSVYSFYGSGADWSSQLKLTAPDGAPSDRFGYSVSINGSHAIVGCELDDIGSNSDQGSAYIYWNDGPEDWYFQTKLTASDGAAGDNFGNSVFINGTYAIVGAKFDDKNTNQDQGSAYIFSENAGTWTQLPKLTAFDGETWDAFGSSVSVFGDYALVGAYRDGAGPNLQQGSAYLFKRNGNIWDFLRKVEPVDGGVVQEFGFSVAINGFEILIGSPLAFKSGSVSFLNIE